MCRFRLAGWLGFVDLETGDGFGGGPGDLGDQALLVVDLPGGVRGFHGQRPSSMDDTDVDPLPSNDRSAATADPSLDAERLRCRSGWWPGGAGVTQPGLLGPGERVGQAAQQHALVDELE